MKFQWKIFITKKLPYCNTNQQTPCLVMPHKWNVSYPFKAGRRTGEAVTTAFSTSALAARPDLLLIISVMDLPGKRRGMSVRISSLFGSRWRVTRRSCLAPAWFCNRKVPKQTETLIWAGFFISQKLSTCTLKPLDPFG